MLTSLNVPFLITFAFFTSYVTHRLCCALTRSSGTSLSTCLVTSAPPLPAVESCSYSGIYTVHQYSLLWWLVKQPRSWKMSATMWLLVDACLYSGGYLAIVLFLRWVKYEILCSNNNLILMYCYFPVILYRYTNRSKNIVLLNLVIDNKLKWKWTLGNAWSTPLAWFILIFNYFCLLNQLL